MFEWVRDVAESGAFGGSRNTLVPTVYDPATDVGVRQFDSIDQGKAASSDHYTVSRLGLPGVQPVNTSPPGLSWAELTETKSHE